MNRSKILIIGSSNTDMVVKISEFPKPGETLLGTDFIMNPGGKGANQAVAAKRLGADMIFITKIGNDSFGDFIITNLQKEGIDTSNAIRTSDHPTGVALITVNDAGENTIVVAPGANMDLQPTDISNELYQEAGFILLQLEILVETVNSIVQSAKGFHIKVILNPAPAALLSDELLNELFLITPNETETAMITGINPSDMASMEKAGNWFLQKGVENVIITLGSKGAFLMTSNDKALIPVQPVTPIDTTAAGDTFNGALVTALAEEKDLREACIFACKAAAISVTRMGAQASAPYRSEL